jgi:hypothetical protein
MSELESLGSWSSPARAVPASRSRVLASWGVVAGVAAYLAAETNRYRLADVPLPALVGTVLGSLLVAWVLAVQVGPGAPGRGIRPWPIGLALGAVGAGLVVAGLGDPATVDHLDAVLREPVHGAMLVMTGLVAVGLGSGVVAAERTRRIPGAVAVLAALALTTMVAQDLVFFQTNGLRDLRLDLHAGMLFDHGISPYLSAPLTALPADQTLLPFVYPPPTLPLFGALALLPTPVAELLWVSASVAAALATLRIFGLSWSWAGVLLLWPAIAQGLYVGNVAIFVAFLFALGPIFGASLVLGGAFKLQGAIPAIWLVRERRWRQVVTGLVVVAGLCLVTLPVVGLGSWSAWLTGLGAYEASAHRLSGLFGIGLQAAMPMPLFLAIAGVVLLLALVPRGTTGLARLGLATIVASPSLYSHGFVIGLPAFLRLRAFWLWTVLALTSAILEPGWWMAVSVGIAGWFVPAMRREPGEELHPLGAAARPWPTIPDPGDTAGPTQPTFPTD